MLKQRVDPRSSGSIMLKQRVDPRSSGSIMLKQRVDPRSSGSIMLKQRVDPRSSGSIMLKQVLSPPPPTFCCGALHRNTCSCSNGNAATGASCSSNNAARGPSKRFETSAWVVSCGFPGFSLDSFCFPWLVLWLFLASIVASNHETPAEIRPGLAHFTIYSGFIMAAQFPEPTWPWPWSITFNCRHLALYIDVCSHLG